MRTIILFIAILVASLISALSLRYQESKEIVSKANTKLNSSKSGSNELLKKDKLVEPRNNYLILRSLLLN